MYLANEQNIIFYCKASSLLASVRHTTGTQAKLGGEVSLPYITKDEENFVNQEASKAIAELFAAAVKVSKVLTFTINQTPTDALINGTELSIVGDPESPFIAFGMRLQNRAAFNVSILLEASEYMTRFLEYNILRSWYLITKSDTLVAFYTAKIAQLAIAFANSITELYKPLFTPTEIESISTVTVVSDTIENGVTAENSGASIDVVVQGSGIIAEAGIEITPVILTFED